MSDTPNVQIENKIPNFSHLKFTIQFDECHHELARQIHGHRAGQNSVTRTEVFEN